MFAKAKGLFSQVLHVSLYYKVVIANSLIVIIGTVAGTGLTIWHVRNYPNTSDYAVIALLVGGGLVLSIVVNSLVMKVVLTPLDKLQVAIDAVQAGNLVVRVEPGPVSDEFFDQLATMFNQMLAALRQRTQELRQLSQGILYAQEEERQRIARELHDEAAQILTSLLVQLRLLEKSRSLEEAHNKIHDLRNLAAQSLNEVRRVALELRPAILDDLGLGAALATRVDELNATDSASITLQIAGVDNRLPRPIELAFYRVAQEALTNIARHSRAQSACVILKRLDDRLYMEITDDGAGFDSTATKIRPHQGLGLLGMRERLAAIEGELFVISKPGEGTYLLASAPLASQVMGEAVNGHNTHSNSDR